MVGWMVVWLIDLVVVLVAVNEFVKTFYLRLLKIVQSLTFNFKKKKIYSMS